MNEPTFSLDYYDLSNPVQEKLYRDEIYKFAHNYVGEVNFQAEMATVRRRASIGFYRSTEGQDLAITLLENWPQDFDDEQLVSNQAQARDIQLEVCHQVLKGVDAEWMDETDDEGPW